MPFPIGREKYNKGVGHAARHDEVLRVVGQRRKRDGGSIGGKVVGVILKRIGLILLIMHVCALSGMENHNWWQNGRDADPVPPSAMNIIHDFVALRIELLPSDVGPQVWNTISEGLMNSKEFSIEDAAKILERFEDEQDRLEEQERQEQEKEDHRLCFFPLSPNQEDEAEQIESQ